MKRAWAIQLEVLYEVLSIAQKHDIPIWMEYGSLLGTVRHHGYIPWDDDIDLCLFREDYMKFLFILQKELPRERVVRSFYTQKNYEQPKAFVNTRAVIDIGIDTREMEFTKKMWGCPYSGGVDLFPLDYIPKDEAYWKQLIELYKIVYDLGIGFEKYQSSGELEGFVRQIESTLNVTIERGDGMLDSVWKVADSLSMMTTRDEAGFVTWYPEYAMCGARRKRPVDAYSKTVWMDYEMLKVPVPIGYDEVLRTEYGDNYMTPVKGTAGHDYPYYKIQEKKILFNNRIGQIGDIF